MNIRTCTLNQKIFYLKHFGFIFYWSMSYNLLINLILNGKCLPRQFKHSQVSQIPNLFILFLFKPLFFAFCIIYSKKMYHWPPFNPSYFYPPEEYFNSHYPERQNLDFPQMQLKVEVPILKREETLERNQQQSPESKTLDLSKKKKDKTIVKKKKEEEDDMFEFRLKKLMRSAEQKARRQNKARNYYSTLIRIFFKAYLENKCYYQALTRDIIILYNLPISEERICSYSANKFKTLKNYVRLQTIKAIFISDDPKSMEKLAMCKVFRILMRIYLQKHFYLSYRASKNLTKENQAFYLDAKRKFVSMFLTGEEEI